jgi:hypothetical protein
MPRSIHLDLPDDQADALDRVAAILHKNPHEAGALLIGEALRHEQFPHVEFRDSAVGRQACVVGSSLAVWEVVMVAESHGMDPARTASHLKVASPPCGDCPGLRTRLPRRDLDWGLCFNEAASARSRNCAREVRVWVDPPGFNEAASARSRN